MRNVTRSLAVLTVCLLSTTISIRATERPGSEPGTWPQWRGPTRDGQFLGPTWPERLSAEYLRPAWRIDDLGPSYSGPIVGEDFVYTTETRAEREEVVQAYDRATGEQVWEASWIGAMEVPFFAKKNGSWIRATPAYDGQNLFVAGMQDVLVCLDGASGKELWRVDFVREFNTPAPNFGYVSSPLVTDEHVYVQAGASVCKLDKRDGKVLWRTLKDEGGMNGSAFSSPILTSLHGQEQLIVLSRSHLNGIDPDSGDVLWSRLIKAFRGMNILTPIVHEDAVFTAAYGGRAQLLDIRSIDDVYDVSARWDARLQGYMTSPVLIDGCAYFFTRSNRFACLRLEDGEVMWISPPTGDDYWSLVAQGDRILALNDSGELKLISANPDAYEVIDERSLADAATWAHLAVAGTQIVVREQNALAIYEWE